MLHGNEVFDEIRMVLRKLGDADQEEINRVTLLALISIHQGVEVGRLASTDNKAEIRDLDKRLRPIEFSYKVGAAIFAAFGVSIIGLIWGLITGVVKLLVP